MLTISASVGEKGTNLNPDVLQIQKAFNALNPLLTSKPLKDDGLYGKNTGDAIIVFQKKHVMLINPDGRIDPGGKSIKTLEKMLLAVTEPQSLLFPLSMMPEESYKTGIRAFGSNRSNGKRKHAGVDLYAPKGTPVRAMKDGKVIQHYAFYLGTRALEIDHGDMIIRYGEIAQVAAEIVAGGTVKRGQTIGYVGELVFESGTKMSMLHLEAYKGTSTGALTVRNIAPYQRRQDLFDPTSLLDGASMD